MVAGPGERHSFMNDHDRMLYIIRLHHERLVANYDRTKPLYEALMKAHHWKDRRQLHDAIDKEIQYYELTEGPFHREIAALHDIPNPEECSVDELEEMEILLDTDRELGLRLAEQAYQVGCGMTPASPWLSWRVPPSEYEDASSSGRTIPSKGNGRQ